MYFTIKEMAQQLGVTTNKLRYYERMGLLEPHTNERTGYRYYSVRDTRRFNATRLYRAFGLSIAECLEVIGGGEHETLINALDHHEKEMQRDIMFQMDKLQALYFWKPFLSNVLADVDQVKLIRFPTVYRLTISQDEKPIKDKARLQCFEKWLELFPVCSWASRLYMDVFLCIAPHSYDYGLIMPETYMSKYGLLEDGLAERIQGGDYAYTVFRKQTDEPFQMVSHDILMSFIKERGLRVAGDAFSNCIYSTKQDGEVVNYHYFMVRVQTDEA